MASRIATLSGNINDSITMGWEWVDGDSLTINNGVTVTIPASTTIVVGDDTNGIAIQCASTSGTGILVINGTLQIKGNIKQANANWTVNAGGIIEHAGVNYSYTWQIGMLSGSTTNSYLNFMGEANNKVYVRNVIGALRFGGFYGGATARNIMVSLDPVLATRNSVNTVFTGIISSSGKIKAYNTHFDGIGDSTNYLYSMMVNLNASGAKGYFDHVLFTDCTPPLFQALHADSDLQITNITIKTPIQNPCTTANIRDRSCTISCTTAVTLPPKSQIGIRKVWDNAFYGSVLLFYSKSLDVRRNLFISGEGGACVESSGNAARADIWLDNQYIITDSTPLQNTFPTFVETVGSENQRSSVLMVRSADGDVFRIGQSYFPTNAVYKGFVIENDQNQYAASGGSSFIFSVGTLLSGTTGTNITFSDIIFPSTADSNYNPVSGAQVTNSTPLANWTNINKVKISNITTYHNAADVPYGVCGFEPGTTTGVFGGANKVEVCNNLFINPLNTSGKILYGANFTDFAAETFNVHNNAIYHYNSEYYLNPLCEVPVNATHLTSNSGTGDITNLSQPILTDPERHFIKWLKDVCNINNINTFSEVAAYFLTKNDDGFTGPNHFDYYDWIVEGYTPTVPALATAGENGTYIGAVSFQITSPNQFAFADISNAILNEYYISNEITVSGITTSVPISISQGGFYEINGNGIWLTSENTVNNGDVVKVKLQASSNNNETKTATLSIGTPAVTDSFSVTTIAILDSTPDQFHFEDFIDLELNSEIVSSIIVNGINIPSPITISGNNAYYRINTNEYTQTSGNVNNGDLVSVKMNASSSFETTVSTTVEIGGVSDIFSLTTRPENVIPDTTPNQLLFTTILNASPSTTYQSEIKTVTGINTFCSVFASEGLQYKIGNGNWLSGLNEDVILNGNSIQLRANASNIFTTTKTYTLQIGSVNGNGEVIGMSTDWYIITKSSQLISTFASIRHDKGLGNESLYIYLRNSTGKYYDFVSAVFVNTESNNCRKYLIEYPDNNPTTSRYFSELTLEFDELYLIEYFHDTEYLTEDNFNLPSTYLNTINNINTNTEFIKSTIKNKKEIVKVGNDWHLKITNNTNDGYILDKILKDKDGMTIDSLVSGILAKEYQSVI